MFAEYCCHLSFTFGSILARLSICPLTSQVFCVCVSCMSLCMLYVFMSVVCLYVCCMSLCLLYVFMSVVCLYVCLYVCCMSLCLLYVFMSVKTSLTYLQASKIKHVALKSPKCYLDFCLMVVCYIITKSNYHKYYKFKSISKSYSVFLCKFRTRNIIILTITSE